MNKKSTYHFQAGIIVGLFCLITLLSCNSNGKVVASVDNTELTENEAYVLMKYFGYDHEDPEEYRVFLAEWCENEAFKAEMRENHPDDWELVRLRAESFSGELAMYYLQEIELKKVLDTVVSQEEIQTFYDAHHDEFILHDYIVKALYLKIPVGLDFKSEEVHLNYLLKNDKDLEEVNSYAKLYAENYYFNDSTWNYFNEIAADLPASKYNLDNIVLNRTKTYFSDDNFTYFINIIDYKLKDEAPPVDFLNNEIKNIIVANRLQELIEQNESTLIQSIKEKHEIIIHI
ncbi:MAG: hypothetical protein QNK23_11910 [Crocinitomicaceae bacterium]|nr:hypothetical protein [Crocinitomicaceae bacterium]